MLFCSNHYQLSTWYPTPLAGLRHQWPHQSVLFVLFWRVSTSEFPTRKIIICKVNSTSSVILLTSNPTCHIITSRYVFPQVCAQYAIDLNLQINNPLARSNNLFTTATMPLPGQLPFAGPVRAIEPQPQQALKVNSTHPIPGNSAAVPAKRPRTGTTKMRPSKISTTAR